MPLGFLYFLLILLFIFNLFCLFSSFVSLSSFILIVPMRKCLGKHSCMNSTFSMAILNETCFLCFPGVDFVLVGNCYKHFKCYKNKRLSP